MGILFDNIVCVQQNVALVLDLGIGGQGNVHAIANATSGFNNYKRRRDIDYFTFYKMYHKALMFRLQKYKKQRFFAGSFGRVDNNVN